MMKHFLTLLLAVGLAATTTMAQDKPEGKGSLTGIVQDQDGNPISDVKVRAISRRNDETVTEVETDSEGNFELKDLPEGLYAIVFFSPRYQGTNVRAVEINPGKTKKLNEPVKLRPVELYAVIEGAVFNHAGYLVPTVKIVLERIPFNEEEVEKFKQETTTNNSGAFAFRLKGKPAMYRLTAEMKGYETQSITVEVGGSERRHVSIQLEPKQTDQ